MKALKTLFFILFLVSANSHVMAAGLDSLLGVLHSKANEMAPPDLDEKAILCNNIALKYQELGDDNKARFYFMQAVEFTELRIKKQGVWDAQNNYDMASLYQNLGVFESTTGNLGQSKVYMAKAEFYYQRLQSQISEEEFVQIILGFYQSNFARTYHASLYVEAEKYMRDIRTLMSRYNLFQNSELSRLEGELYNAQEKYEDAIIHMKIALDLFDSLPQPSDFQGHQVIHSYVSVLFHLERYTELLNFLDERPYYKTLEIVEDFGLNQEVYEYENFLNTLFIRSYALMRQWNKTKNVQYLIAAFEWQKLSFKLAENNILENRGDKLEMSVSTAKNKVLATVKCALLLEHEDGLETDALLDLLRIIDLYQSARLHVERISYQLNRDVWEEQKKINAEIEYLNLKLSELQDAEAEVQLRDSLRDRSFELSLSLTELEAVSKQEKILEEYKVGQAGFNEMIKHYVEEKKVTILTYLYEEGSDSLFAVGCDPKGSFIQGVAVPEYLNDEINELYQLNGRLLYTASDMARQEELNSLFYERLITPIQSSVSTNQLVVYPLDELGYISFDALKSNSNRYLIEDFSISYTSSLFALFLSDKIENKVERDNEFAAFYPANYGTDSLTYLFNAKAEIDEINTRLNGKIYEGKSASKANFIEAVNESSILHIASHSLLNIEFPYESAIVFDAEDTTGDNKLYAYEIFAKTINADLVILSSCNSAHGEIEEGIGIVSLSNAFFFAGTPSTISSLWSAQDLSSSEIMIEFYRQLKLGKTKSASLRAAKLAYLDKADKLKIQPFFWANYVVYGSDVALFEAESSTKWYTYLIGVLSCIALFFIGNRYFKSLNKV